MDHLENESLDAPNEPRSQEQNSIKRDEKGRLLPGHGLVSPGRPKGSISIKDLVRQHLEDNPQDLAEFVRHFIKKNRELAWQMIEGRPAQSTDLTSGGKPIPILGNVSINDSNSEDSKPQETS